MISEITQYPRCVVKIHDQQMQHQSHNFANQLNSLQLYEQQQQQLQQQQQSGPKPQGSRFVQQQASSGAPASGAAKVSCIPFLFLREVTTRGNCLTRLPAGILLLPTATLLVGQRLEPATTTATGAPSDTTTSARITTSASASTAATHSPS